MKIFVVKLQSFRRMYICRVFLHFCDDFFSRKWSDDSRKWSHYSKNQFDLDWMKRRVQTYIDEGENKAKKKRDSESTRERVCSFSKKLEFCR